MKLLIFGLLSLVKFGQKEVKPQLNQSRKSYEPFSFPGAKGPK